MADNIQATPRNYLGGLLSDAYKWMQSPERTQQMQGFAGLLGTTGVPQTIERMAYGEPLTNIGRANVPLLKPETADALMTVAPMVGPAARGAGRIAGSAVNEAMVYGRGPLASITPQPMYAVQPSIVREGNPIQSAVVLIGDRIFTGRTHGDALNRAIYEGVVRKEGGKFIYPKGAEVDSDLFMTKDGQIIDRFQASKMFDIGASETAIEEGLMQNKPPSSMSVDSYIEQAKAIRQQKEKPSFTYPQEEAMRLAQQRAALPVEQGGLGLSPSNTADERAAAMGFDTSALHGSGSPNIEKFNPELVGTKAGNPFDNYMWSTSSPEAASAYSLNPKSFNELPEVKSLNARIQDISKATADAYKNSEFDKMSDLQVQKVLLQKQTSDLYKEFQKGNILSEESTVYPLLLKTDEFMPYEAGGKNWMSANRKAIDKSQESGFQGVAIKNVKDNPNREVNSIIADTYATENPDLLRSRFAAFDPFRRTAATAAAMGVAAPDLLAQEQPVITQQQIDEELARYGLLGR